MEFAKTRPVIGFDINQVRVCELRSDRDRMLEASTQELAASKYLA